MRQSRLSNSAGRSLRNRYDKSQIAPLLSEPFVSKYPSPNINHQTISLTEYQAVRFPLERFSARQAERLWQRHRQQVLVEPPSFKTQGEWQLTAQGWIGLIALERDLAIALQPKVPLSNLFTMMAYAYGLDEFSFGDDFVKVETISGFIDRLAYHYVKRVRRQQQHGLYRSYAEATAAVPFIRGQLDMASLWTVPLGRDVVCHFEELTTDVLENQIIVWTLSQLVSSGLCSVSTNALCRGLLAELRQEISLHEFGPDECNRIVFHQLNYDYKPLIALSRLFLSGYEVSHSVGEELAPPFLINSAMLFERFVAGWLQRNLHDRYRLYVQERRAIGLHEKLHFAIDLTVYDQTLDQALFVMDTKYKLPMSTPDTADIAQVVAYAEAVGAVEAVLIYPSALPQPLDERIGRIRVRSLTFDLDADVETAGCSFLERLLAYEAVQ